MASTAHRRRRSSASARRRQRTPRTAVAPAAIVATGAAARVVEQLQVHLTGERVRRLARTLDERRLEATAVAISLLLCVVIAYLLGA